MTTALKELDFNNIKLVIITLFLVTVIVFFRYLFLSSAYHFLFFTLLKKRFQKRILRKKNPKKKQILKEIYWSALSGFIFGAFMLFCFYLWSNNNTLIYEDVFKYSLWYIPLSIVLFLFLQDTFYYWAHRFMHHPKIYKYVHLVHHKSIHTSVFTSFSFHPLETILQALFLPIVICVLPLHHYAILFVLIIMTISATINHAGVEVYPSRKFGKWFQQIFIGATHHDKHHTKFNYNYGLYFTFWDRIMKTEFEAYKN